MAVRIEVVFRWNIDVPISQNLEHLCSKNGGYNRNIKNTNIIEYYDDNYNFIGKKIKNTSVKGYEIVNGYGFLYHECGSSVEIAFDKLLKDAEKELTAVGIGKVVYLLKHLSGNNILYRKSNGEIIPVDERYLIKDIFQYASKRGKDFLKSVYELNILRKININNQTYIMANPVYFRVNIKKNSKMEYSKISTVNRIPKLTAYVYKDEILKDLDGTDRINNFRQYIYEISDELRLEILENGGKVNGER